MSASFATALVAAEAAAGSQHYPQGALYVVATPIGNLADITLRALHVLQLVDAIACEDTRHTQSLLRCYGLSRPAQQLIALHQHNEAEAATRLIALLQQGQRVAYVSDAGTPGVSDPGARLVAAVQAAGLRAMPIPGASSLTAALSVAGCHPGSGRSQELLFIGFLPTKAGERQALIAQLAAEPRCVVLLEAPHRMAELAQSLAALGTRPVTLARELTKQFETLCTQPADTLPAWLQADPARTRGEFVVVLHPIAADTQDAHDQSLRTLRLLLAELPVKTAVRLAVEITGAPRNLLYEAALQLRQARDDKEADAAP